MNQKTDSLTAANGATQEDTILQMGVTNKEIRDLQDAEENYHDNMERRVYRSTNRDLDKLCQRFYQMNALLCWSIISALYPDTLGTRLGHKISLIKNVHFQKKWLRAAAYLEHTNDTMNKVNLNFSLILDSKNEFRMGGDQEVKLMEDLIDRLNTSDRCARFFADNGEVRIFGHNIKWNQICDYYNSDKFLMKIKTWRTEINPYLPKEGKNQIRKEQIQNTMSISDEIYYGSVTIEIINIETMEERKKGKTHENLKRLHSD